MGLALLSTFTLLELVAPFVWCEVTGGDATELAPLLIVIMAIITVKHCLRLLCLNILINLYTCFGKSQLFIVYYLDYTI